MYPAVRSQPHLIRRILPPPRLPQTLPTPLPPPPFQRISREIRVDNAWHLYCRDRYTHTAGSTGTYYYVDHRAACAAIPLFADGSTVVLRVHRYLLDPTDPVPWVVWISVGVPGLLAAVAHHRRTRAAQDRRR